MEYSKLKITGTDANTLSEFITNNYKISFIKPIGKAILLSGEEYRLRNNSDQMFLIIIEKEEDSTIVELICGGGGEGIFSFTLGSERAFVTKTKKLLKEYCETNMLGYKELE